MCKKKYAITAALYDKRGNVLSIGKNSYVKTHTLQARIAKQLGMDEKIYLHAEIDCIVRCKHLDKAHKIAVFRWDSDGKPVSAKPCRICLQAIENAGIKIVTHT